MNPKLETALHLLTIAIGTILPDLAGAGVPAIVCKVLGLLVAGAGAFNLQQHGLDQADAKVRAAGSIVAPLPEAK
jgi:hypothetical protein